VARARNLKPSFFTNEQLADLEPLARLLFQGLWLHADREGRLEDRPRKLKAEILPYDDCDPEALLASLQAAGFIQRYEVGGNRCIVLPTFMKHQNPHPKEPASTLPAPVDNLKPRSSRGKTRPVLPLPIPSSSPLPPSEIPPPEETALSGKPDAASIGEQAREVFDHWAGVMAHPQAIFGPKRERAVVARIKQGFSVARLKLAIEGCKKSTYHQGGNKENAIHDDLELICRDVEHVEMFLGFYERPQGGSGNGNGRVVGEAAPVPRKYSDVGIRPDVSKN